MSTSGVQVVVDVRVEVSVNSRRISTSKHKSEIRSRCKITSCYQNTEVDVDVAVKNGQQYTQTQRWK